MTCKERLLLTLTEMCERHPRGHNVEDIAKESGLKPWTVRGYLTELQAMGVVTSEPRAARKLEGRLVKAYRIR